MNKNPFNILMNNQQTSSNNALNGAKMSEIQELYKMFTSSKNPYAVFQKMALKNPNMSQVMNLLNNGFNPRDVFYKLCQSKGVNPNEFIEMIKGK